MKKLIFEEKNQEMTKKHENFSRRQRFKELDITDKHGMFKGSFFNAEASMSS